jgi:hypothetical protein
MKNEGNSKMIDKELLKESLLEYNNLAGLIKESYKNSYSAFLNESEEDDEDKDSEGDFDVEQVEDTTEEPVAEAEKETQDDDSADPNVEDGQEILNDGDDTDENPEGEDKESLEDENIEGGDTDDDVLASEFGDYEVSDGEYDLTSAKDDDVVKVFKRLKDTDGVTVVKDNDKIALNDGENEYIIDLGGSDNTESEDNNIEVEIEDNNMNESTERVFEVMLNEYDSHVGYTDNYQSEDTLTTDGVKEPGNGRDIDKGIPHDTKKPWANPDKKAKPFDKGTKNECGNADAPLEEQAGNKMGSKTRQSLKSRTTNSGEPNKHPNNPRVNTVAGEYMPESKTLAEYKAVLEECKKTIAENKKLKETVANFTKLIKEAAVTNVNLGGIVKLITENSTSKEEKKQIIGRFANEVKTVEESRNLYETIQRELSAKPQNAVNINEEKQFSATEKENINESKFYQDESLQNSLGLMSKICPNM